VNPTSLLFDGVLALVLLGLAWRVLATRDLFEGVVLFIAFGLLMPLAWVRLHAPDIALAEAAIGAGLTGALLLDAVSHLSGGRRPPAGENADAREPDSFKG
jgi:energy-converting hydrogenase B subunit D